MKIIILKDHGLVTGRLAVHVRAATPRQASGKVIPLSYYARMHACMHACMLLHVEQFYVDMHACLYEYVCM